MKIFCIRYPRNFVTDILLSLLCIFIISLILINAEYKNDVTCGASDSLIVKFITDNGWDADLVSGTVEEKIIPTVFNKTYEEYSALQKSQGFDIESYKGCKIYIYSYPLKNYPGYEDNENIYIDILIHKNEIIGADILCTSINGFITGAVKKCQN